MRRRDPLTLGILGGALFGATVIHGTAAAAEVLLRGDSSGSLATAYGMPGWPLLAYHIVLGAAGGVLLGAVLRRRLRQEEHAMDLERRLLRAQRMEAVARLAAGVNHDVKNLLSALTIRLHLAATAPDADERRRNLEEARRITDKAAELPRRLLAFARDRPDAASVDGHGTDACVVAEAALDLIEPVLGSLRLERRLELVPAVRLDASSLEQVVVNLVLNARDALDGAGAVWVTLHAEGAGAVLCVEDDGPGVPVDARERVFEAFYTTKPEGEGTGLGLDTCRMLVEGAGGTITLGERPGGGASFRVELPALPP